MLEYKNGKIYAIVSDQTDKIYIGSTCNYLSSRFYDHKRTNIKITSKQILAYNDCRIELIENYPCKTKKELLEREAHYIRINKDKCVNICIPLRTHKEYNEDNKEKRKLKNKEWRKNNEDELKKKKAEYYTKKKEEIILKAKLYYEKNKDTINLDKKIKRNLRK